MEGTNQANSSLLTSEAKPFASKTTAGLKDLLTDSCRLDSTNQNNNTRNETPDNATLSKKEGESFVFEKGAACRPPLSSSICGSCSRYMYDQNLKRSLADDSKQLSLFSTGVYYGGIDYFPRRKETSSKVTIEQIAEDTLDCFIGSGYY